MPCVEAKKCTSDISYEGPFTPAYWISATAELSSNGILDILHEGRSVRQININDTFTSSVSALDFSVFFLPRVIYVADPTSNSSTRTSFIRHTNNTINEKDSSVYLKFTTKGEVSTWLRALKSLARIQVIAPSTANPLDSARMLRFLKIRVLEAKLGLIKHECTFKDNEFYTELVIENRIWGRTTMSKSTKQPFWGEDFNIPSIPIAVLPDFILRVWKRCSEDPAMDKVMGTVKLSYTDVKENRDTQKWYKLLSGNRETGSLCVKISLEELMVGVSGHYKELEDVINSIAVKDVASLVLSEKHNQNPEQISISEMVLNIALSKPSPKCTIGLLSTLITHEINKLRNFIVKKRGSAYLSETHVCSEAELEFKKNINNTLFRGNTILTKSLETFMRVVGHDHLTATIGAFVQELITTAPEIEIDPSKVIVPEGETMENVLKANQERLLDYANRIWRLILSSVDEMPVSFKAVFRHLATELSSTLHFPQSDIYNCVAGFLFLRLYCPCLINPKLFSMVNCRGVASLQRSLTIITKIIMCFANRSRFGMKEPWLIPMNVFFDLHEDELMEFFKKVTLENLTSEEVETMISNESRFPDVVSTITPLSERLSVEYMIDRDLNLARLLVLWKNVLHPNRDEFFASIQTSAPPSPNLSYSESTEKFSLEDLYRTCEKTHNTIDRIVKTLKEPEVFNPGRIKDYADHINLSYDNNTATLTLLPEMKSTPDWFISKSPDDRFESSLTKKQRPLSGTLLYTSPTSAISNTASNFILDSPKRSNSLPPLGSLSEFRDLHLSSPRGCISPPAKPGLLCSGSENNAFSAQSATLKKGTGSTSVLQLPKQDLDARSFSRERNHIV